MSPSSGDRRKLTALKKNCCEPVAVFGWERIETQEMKKKVLFICVHNSARSQMAEAWFNHFCGDDWEAQSAGLEPGRLNPTVVEAMREVGIDISGNKTQAVFDVWKSGELFTYVITVCNEADAEGCPVFSLDRRNACTGLFPIPRSSREHPRRSFNKRARCAKPSDKKSRSGAPTTAGPLSQTKAPPQLEPAPAVQPKQCSPVRISRSSTCVGSISHKCSPRSLPPSRDHCILSI